MVLGFTRPGRPKTDPLMWIHECRAAHDEVATECGAACNWCGLEQPDVPYDERAVVLKFPGGDRLD